MGEKKKPKGRMFVIVTAIVTVVVCLLSYLLLAAMGEKAGLEFSPDDFSFRKFNYCKLPILNWTQRGIEYKTYTNTTAETLMDDDWIRPTGRNPKRWHLVAEGGGSEYEFEYESMEGYSVACDARFLTKFFNMTDDEGNNRIIDWNDNQPKSAKFFWPLIADMARDNAYLQIPKIMDFVLDYPQPDQSDTFEAEVKTRISEAWYQTGLLDQINQQHVRAVARFDKAIEVGGDAGHQKAKLAIAESMAASQ